MAEIVTGNTEKVLPQLAEVIKLKLFSDEEMKEILQRHVENEYKISKRKKGMKDYYLYIAYKKELLTLARDRMKKKKVSKGNKRKVENMFRNHIHRLYRYVIRNHKQDPDVWLHCIQFMKEEKQYATVTVLYDGLLKYHSHLPELFIEVAKFQMSMKQFDCARSTLFQAIRFHGDNRQLFVELVNLELEYAESQRQLFRTDERMMKEDPVLCGRVVEVTTRRSLSTFPDLEFKITLLKMCFEHDFIQPIQRSIYQKMKTEHETDPKMWKTIALFQLGGYYHLEPSNEFQAIPSNDPQEKNIGRCYQILMKGVETIRNYEMWYQCLDTLFELMLEHVDQSDFIRILIVKTLKNDECKHIPVNHFITWLEKLDTYYTEDKLVTVLDAMLRLFPTCEHMWLRKLKYNLEQVEGEKFRLVLEDAWLTLKSENSRCLLCEFLLEKIAQQPELRPQINSFMERMVGELTTSFTKIRSLYLQWVMGQENDLENARRMFAKFATSPPYVKKFYRQMVALETRQEKVDAARVRQLYEVAVFYFGSSDIGVWLNYINFERQYGNPVNISNIYWKAVKELEASLSDRFIAQYSILKAE